MATTTTLLELPIPELEDAANIEEAIHPLAEELDKWAICSFSTTGERDGAIQTPVAGEVCFIEEKNIPMYFDGSNWIPIIQVVRGISNVAVTSGENETGSNVFKQMGGTGAIVTFSWRKLVAASRVHFWMVGNAWQKENSGGTFAVGYNNGAWQICKIQGDCRINNHFAATGHMNLGQGDAARLYTIGAVWKCQSSQNISRNVNDWLVLFAEEIQPEVL